MTEDVKRIIAGLRFCAHAFNCYDCPATDDLCNMNDELQDKAADLIEQLTAELEQVKRERDAAVWDIKNSQPCFACRHFQRNEGSCKGGRQCMFEMLTADEFGEEYEGLLWQWRGVCAENGGAEDVRKAQE